MDKPKLSIFGGYVLIVILWLIIFWKNSLSRLFFLDYTPGIFVDIKKNLILSNFVYNFYLFDAFKLFLSFFDLIQIAFQLSILASMLVSFHYAKKLLKSNSHALLFSLVFFFNPFAYSRIMSGQIGILLSYLLMPVYLYYLFNLFSNGFDRKSIMKLAIAITITSSLSPHFFVLDIIIFLVASFWLYFYKNNENKLRSYLKAALILVILLFFLNLYWLQGLISSGLFSAINQEHESFFSPKLSEDIPAAAKVIGMWGFWREGAYHTTYDSIPIYIWYFMLAALATIMILGYYSAKNSKSMFFYSLFWLGLIFGTGISHPYTKLIFDFLFDHMPLFSGFRDSHKFVSLIALSYAYLCSGYIMTLKEKLHGKIRMLIISLFILLFLAYTYPMIALDSQIKPVDYPSEYIELGKFFDSSNIKGDIIYLPWETYLTYNWTLGISSDGRISNPINGLVRPAVLVGEDKFGYATRKQSAIKSCLEQENKSCLEEANVQYIIHDICALYPDSYEWIAANIEYKKGCIILYKIDNKPVIESKKTNNLFIFATAASLAVFISYIFFNKRSRGISN